MRYVKKGTEPLSLARWKELECENWRPSYSILRNPQKRDLHLALLHEQGMTCCYCGIEIDLESSHIEHFRPQDHYETLSLSYENLFASCIRETNPNSPLHCGHLKGDWFDERCYVSPLDETCESLFTYTLDGRIAPTTHEANRMLVKLGLENGLLESRRKAAIAGVFDDLFLVSASLSDIETLATAFRQPNSAGEYAPFFHVVARYAEQLIAGIPGA